MAKFDRIFWDSKSVLIESVIDKKKKLYQQTNTTEIKLSYKNSLRQIASLHL